MQVYDGVKRAGCLYARPAFSYQTGGKRLFDLLITLTLAPVWIPLTCILWCLSWLEAGQGFYADIRIGRDGRAFRCWKIRTMQVGGVRGCAALKPVRDPRITRLGRFLRRSSLDEVPQFWCILKGQMSLVGPRPVPRVELHLYGPLRWAYLAQRPGLTGLWQISGRNALSYGERVCLDLRYLHRSSVALDASIALRTISEMLRMNGR